MTLEQLKSLRVGDIVRYTNKEDASNTYVTKVSSVLDWQIEFYDGVGYTPISFDDKDIEHIASTLAFVPPTSTNELQIILHQIRDCEFDITHRLGNYGKAVLGLVDLRNKRDNLLKQGA